MELSTGDSGSFFFFLDFYSFLESGERKEKEREKHQCVAASHATPTGDLARNSGVCPDGESEQGPFGSQASPQSTEPHQPGSFPNLISGPEMNPSPSTEKGGSRVYPSQAAFSDLAQDVGVPPFSKAQGFPRHISLGRELSILALGTSQ